MKTTLTANQLSGRAIGSIFFAGFGALWLLLSLYAREILSVDLAVCVASGLAALLLGAFWLLRQSSRYPKMPEDPAINRAFHRINGLQWAAAIAVAVVFARLHIDAYMPSAITAIVGIHMFPLAKLFRYPMHNITGVVLVAWASASVLLAPVEHLQSVTAFGTGIILWISAATTLALGAVAMRRNVPAADPGSLYA